MKDDHTYVKTWPEMVVEPDMCSQFYIETVYTCLCLGIYTMAHGVRDHNNEQIIFLCKTW